METNKILNAQFLDILFDGRNKEYGAYDLRKSYNKRLAIAMLGTGSVLLLLFLGSVLANVLAKDKNIKMEVESTVVLTEVHKPVDRIELPPPPQKIPEPPKVKMEQFTPPQIVKDNEVPENEKPPVVDELVDVKIGLADQDGAKDVGFTAPPPETGTGEAVVPKQAEEDYNKVFMKVEIPAEFPGGLEGWRRYLERNLHYPDGATDNGTQGIVKVQLVVDKLGNISDVLALNDPGDGLAEEAVRIIKKGPKWIPAQQNGQAVTYRFTQTVTFQLQQ